MNSFAMNLNSIKGLIDTITNPDIHGIEKFTAILMNEGMIVNCFTSTASSLGKIMNWLNNIFEVNTLKQQKKIALMSAEQIQISDLNRKEIDYYTIHKLRNLENNKTITINLLSSPDKLHTPRLK